MSHYDELRYVSYPSLEALSDMVLPGPGVVSRDLQIDARVNHAWIEGHRIGPWIDRNVDLTRSLEDW